MTNSFMDRLRQSWPKLGAVSTALAAQAWLLWPDPPWSFQPEPAIMLAAAVGAWIYLELIARPTMQSLAPPPDGRPHRPHPHDLDLFAQLDALLPQADRVFLRDHDFRLPFSTNRLRGLEEIALGWRSAEFEFHDETLQTVLQRLRKRGMEFGRLTGSHLHSVDGQPGLVSPLGDNDRAGGVSEDTLRRIEELNAKARQVFAEIDLLMKQSRDRLRNDQV